MQGREGGKQWLPGRPVLLGARPEAGADHIQRCQIVVFDGGPRGGSAVICTKAGGLLSLDDPRAHRVCRGGGAHRVCRGGGAHR